MTPLESLLLELIPTRLTPAPKATTGPTEQWAAAERQRELWRVAAECVSDGETVSPLGILDPSDKCAPVEAGTSSRDDFHREGVA